MAQLRRKLITALLVSILTNKHARRPLLAQFDKIVREELYEENELPPAVVQKKLEYIRALIRITLQNLDKGHVSKPVTKRIVETLVTGAFFDADTSKEAIGRFAAQYGEAPPHFLVLSPSQRCNLRCVGCYAAANEKSCATLPYETVVRIADEAINRWGNRFMVISGGEPLLYRDGERTLFDLFERFPQTFFLFYTNATLITPEVAQRLARLGNVTPAISVEGFEHDTDERRGRGIHQRILKSFACLREAGVPFGISVTATSRNAQVLLQDEFYEFYFEQQGATYMWQFQLMPIGRARDAKELALTPEQRVALYHKWRELLPKYPIADFWNSGVLADGCIAYGRGGTGYVYIDWHGKIMPCVFIPYYVDTVQDLFSGGKTISDALFSRFFKNGRAWQREYGLDYPGRPHNWLMPCSIRDHYANFRERIITPDAKPENEDAREALESREYLEMMERFDSELKALTDPLWQEEYLGAVPCAPARSAPKSS